MNFDTLLIIFGLTYYLSAPQCQFLFSAVFVFQVFSLLKVPEKIQENYIKNQRRRNFRKSQSGARGPPSGALVARPHPRSCPGGAWTPWWPPGCLPSPI